MFLVFCKLTLKSFKNFSCIFSEQLLAPQQSQPAQQEIPYEQIVDALPEEKSHAYDANQTPVTSETKQDDSVTTSLAVTLGDSKSVTDETTQEAEAVVQETTQEGSGETPVESVSEATEEEHPKDTPKVRHMISMPLW